MPKRVAEVGEGNEDGNGVYGFIRDLIVEGKDARFVNKEGRYVINWSRALDCYTKYKSKKNPQFKNKKICRRKASNGLRAALLNFYKKEGAKEYKESKKVNDKDEVVERQFQMPPRVFESLFGEVQRTDDSEQEEQETSSLVSEGDIEAQATPSTSASDTGFDEVMDMSFYDLSQTAEPGDYSFPADINVPINPCLDGIKIEEDFQPDVTIPSQMFDTSLLDSALEEIWSDGVSDEISEDMDLLGVVQDICPTSGSVKGGFQFNITLIEELPADVTSGIAQFEGVADVLLHKLNPFTFSGIIPPSHEPGDVPVTVITQAGQRLGMTCFRYVDEMREMVRQLVKDPTLQSLWFAIWSQEHGFFGSDSNVAQSLGPMIMQDQDSSGQANQQQSLKVLQLLVYTAAQTDAQQFIEMIFSTSAGQIVFNSYKDKTQLPEDVARANGHEDLAQYLQDVNIRLSQETSFDVQSNTIDWLELVKAVQKQASVSEDKLSKRFKHPCENDDNSSDYFADAETSSCGSQDLDAGLSDSEDRESTYKGHCTKDGVSNKEPTERLVASLAEGATNGIPDEKEEQENYKIKVSIWGCTDLFSEWLSKWRKRENTLPTQQGTSLDEKDRTGSSTCKSRDTWPIQQGACLDEKDTNGSSTCKSFPGVTFLSGLFGKDDGGSEANVQGTSKTRRAKRKEYGQHNHMRSPRKTEAAFKYKGVVLAFVFLSVLAGLKLGEGQILHWAVGNGYTQISKLLLHCGVFVDAPGFLRETPLHVASRLGFLDLVDVLVQNGGNVNSRNFPSQETPLHLAAQNGHQHIAEFLIRHGSKVNARNVPWQNTPLHLAAQNGHKHVADVLLQHHSDVNARNVPFQSTPLHLATENGHTQIAEVLIQHGSDVNARNGRKQASLHLAAQNGHKRIAEALVGNGSYVNIGPMTPLHLAAQFGHKEMSEFLIQHGGDVNARSVPLQDTPLHLAAENGHKHITEVLIQHGSDINAVNSRGQVLLHLVDWTGTETEKVIVLQCPNRFTDSCNPWQNTPLHLAAVNGHKHVAEALIQHGSDVNIRNNLEQTPLHVAAQNGHKHTAEVLIQHGSDLSTGWQTPLHLAAQSDHLNVVKVLIWGGSSTNTTNVPFQTTPVHLAAENGHKPVVQVLTQHSSDVNTRNKFVLPAIYLAAQNGQKHTVEVLTQDGSDVRPADYGHKQPSEVLIQYLSRAQDVVKQQCAFDVTAENENQHSLEVFVQHGGPFIAGGNLFQKPFLYLPAKNKRASYKHFRAILEQIKNNSLQLNSLDLAHWSVLCGIGGGVSIRKRRSSAPILVKTNKTSYLHHQASSPITEEPVGLHSDTKRRRSIQGFTKTGKARLRSFQVCFSCADEPLGFNRDLKRCDCSQSCPETRKTCCQTCSPCGLTDSYNTYQQKRCDSFQSNTKTSPHPQICFPCMQREEPKCRGSALFVSKNSSDSFVFGSSDRKIGEMMSWYGLIFGFTGKCISNSFNELLMDNVQPAKMNTQDERNSLTAAEVVVVVGILLVLLIGFLLWCTHRLRLHFQRTTNSHLSQEYTVSHTICTGDQKDALSIHIQDPLLSVSHKSCTTTLKDLPIREPSMEEPCMEDHHEKDLTKDQHMEESMPAKSTTRISGRRRPTQRRSMPQNWTNRPQMDLHKEELRVDHLPMEDASMEDLRMERLRSWLAKDLDAEITPTRSAPRITGLRRYTHRRSMRQNCTKFLQMNLHKEELSMDDLPMEDACMEDLRMECRRSGLTKDLDAGEQPSVDDGSNGTTHGRSTHGLSPSMKLVLEHCAKAVHINLHNENLSADDLPIEDSCMVELQMEHFRSWLTGDHDGEELPSVDSGGHGTTHGRATDGVSTHGKSAHEHRTIASQIYLHNEDLRWKEELKEFDLLIKDLFMKNACMKESEMECLRSRLQNRIECQRSRLPRCPVADELPVGDGGKRRIFLIYAHRKSVRKYCTEAVQMNLDKEDVQVENKPMEDTCMEDLRMHCPRSLLTRDLDAEELPSVDIGGLRATYGRSSQGVSAQRKSVQEHCTKALQIHLHSEDLSVDDLPIEDRCIEDLCLRSWSWWDRDLYTEELLSGDSGGSSGDSGGNEDGNGVYGFIRDLIVEGKDARFVNKKGRYVINWSRALDCYTDYKSKKNPQFKSKKICRRKASNGLRAALLNFYKKEGAKEYKESKKVNDKDEVVERQFQMPPRVLESLFGEVQLTDDSEQEEQETSSLVSEEFADPKRWGVKLEKNLRKNT